MQPQIWFAYRHSPEGDEKGTRCKSETVPATVSPAPNSTGAPVVHYSTLPLQKVTRQTRPNVGRQHTKTQGRNESGDLPKDCDYNFRKWAFPGFIGMQVLFSKQKPSEHFPTGQTLKTDVRVFSLRINICRVVVEHNHRIRRAHAFLF